MFHSVRETEYDWNTGKHTLVHFGYVPQGGRADRDDDVDAGIFIFAANEVSYLFLLSGVRELNRIHAFTIELDTKRRVFEGGANSLINEVDERIRSAYFIEDEDVPDWSFLRLRCRWESETRNYEYKRDESRTSEDTARAFACDWHDAPSGINA